MPQLSQAIARQALAGARGNEFDNTAIVARVTQLRAERAKIMGYDNYAAYVLEDETAKTPEAAKAALDLTNLVYVPLDALDQRFVDLLALREHLGLRSPVNTALRALNPCGARAQVQGVFHPPYRGLQQDGALALGEQNLRVLKGGGGEFERQPNKAVELMGLENGAPFDGTAPALMRGAKRMSEAADGASDPSALGALWSGTLTDEFALNIVLGTAALALGMLEGLDHSAAYARAQSLWQARAR